MTLDNQKVHLVAIPAGFQFAVIFSHEYNEQSEKFEQLASVRLNASSTITKPEIAEQLRQIAERMDSGNIREVE